MKKKHVKSKNFELHKSFFIHFDAGLLAQTPDVRRAREGKNLNNTLFVFVVGKEVELTWEVRTMQYA